MPDQPGDLAPSGLAPHFREPEIDCEHEAVDDDQFGEPVVFVRRIDDQPARQTERRAYRGDVGTEASPFREILEVDVNGKTPGRHEIPFVMGDAVPRVRVVFVDAEPERGRGATDDRHPGAQPERADRLEGGVVVTADPGDRRHDQSRKRPSSKMLMNDPNAIRPDASATA